MLRIVLILIFLYSTLFCSSQNVETYKVKKIDSIALKEYFIITVENNKDSLFKIFSKKPEITEKGILTGKKIKIGKKYCLKLTENQLNFDKLDEVEIRGKYDIYVDSVLILKADEKSYISDNIIGDTYKKNKRTLSK